MFDSSYRYIEHCRYADVVTGRLCMNIMFFSLVLVYTKCKEVLSGILFS